MLVDITPVYAGLLTLWIVALAFRIGLLRQRLGIGLGDGGVPELSHAVRAHGNAVETVPLTLLLMVLAEQIATPSFVLHLLGIALLAGRLLHGAYFLRGASETLLRGAGMGLTVLVQVLLAAGLIAHALAGAGPA